MEDKPGVGGAAGDLSGCRLGGYRIVRRLGSGAMADVYLAEQTSLGRHVAVKVLRPTTLRNPAAVSRFEQEARAAASLVHGHIVQIHEVACIDGVHFLAEEYVAGPSLRAWLDARGPLAPRQALAVLAQVGSALARAAQQGIVHRDIKPENLLVTPAGDVKVADFGLVRVAGEELELTQDGMTLGTPLYMSPEQGEGRQVDARSDLYSLGATIYHLLAGTPPFGGSSAIAVVMAHIKEPLPALALKRPDLPAGLCLIVERLLAKEPAERFASPQELLQAVSELEISVAPGMRHSESPLAWDADDLALFGGAGDDPRSEALAGVATVSIRKHTVTGRLREATMHLDAVAGRVASERTARRRAFVATIAAAFVAAAAGFAMGRSRPQPSTIFRRRR
ncbi:MAG: serine/threonine protein kinase [Planctomycetes bacterium]|nr:serine/threonine protein kinase [Planctomycetota bacterium]